MIIAFTTKGTDWDSMMDPRFGRTEFFLIYDEENDKLETFDNRSSSDDAHGAGPKTAQALFGFDADVLVTGNGPGGNAAAVLKKARVDIYVGAGDMTVRQAYEAYKDKELTKF